ncbi:hypothetical protein JTE90_019842 [Oedothorax gibbosus]|uniref:WD repeat, SAM and U-box domain-containing protein 1 n=1 Tax=Oedothorax gibbosus TaxID=931172 RepID=A0AAV6V7R0_9ARAC|nr:hypothetical protein JTE90_019842 [Oedothorax gibbosus]
MQVLEGHSCDVTSCDFSGKYLASCSGDKSVRLWEINLDGKFEKVDFSPLLGHTYAVNCVRFSPFGTLLASCSTDGKAILWNLQNGEKVAEMQYLNGSPIRACSFASSSAVFATGSDDELVVLWDIATKSAIRVFEGHEGMVTAVAFTPDSAFLVSCSTAEEIMLWDGLYGHGKCLATVNNAHDLGILGCDISPQYEAISENGFLNGHYTIATCGNDDLVKIWSVKTSTTKSITLVTTFEGHTGNVMACRFSHDGALLASAGGDRIIFLWNMKTGQAVKKLEGHLRYITCCAFSKEALMATGSNDKTVIVWSLDKHNILNTSGDLSATDKEKSLKLSHKESFLSWTVEDVIRWLKSLDLEEFSEAFRHNSIDGKELVHLTHENLHTVMKIDSLGSRNKILRGIQCLKNPMWQHVLGDTDNDGMLTEFCCPITQDVMRNPVVAADGYSYEKQAIEEWFESGKETSPMTNEKLAHKLLIPNHVLQQLIQKNKD